MSTESPFSSSFALYLDSLRVQHTVRTEGSAQEHADALASLLDLLRARGHAISEAGLEAGQERHEITSYVVAALDKGGHAVHCYRSHDQQGPVHGGVIYDRHFPKLPFDPLAAPKKYDGPGRLPRDKAEKGGYILPCRMQIIVERTGEEFNGHATFRFVDIVSGVKDESSSPSKEPEVPEDPEALVAKITAHISQKVNSVEEMDRAIERVAQHKPKLAGFQWNLVLNTIKSKLAILVATANDDEPAKALLKSHRELLGEKLVADVHDFLKTKAESR